MEGGGEVGGGVADKLPKEVIFVYPPYCTFIFHEQLYYSYYFRQG